MSCNTKFNKAGQEETLSRPDRLNIIHAVFSKRTGDQDVALTHRATRLRRRLLTDGRLYSRGQEIKPLDINVTKADATIWGELAKSPAGVSRTRSIDAVCDSLLQRIMSKKDVSKGPNLVLALEAVHFPVTKPVADRFVEKYKHISGAVGFSQIWLVGPTVSLTHQLA